MSAANELRPKFTPEIARAAATDIVAELIKQGHLEEGEREDCVTSLAKHGRQHEDGYQIAKRLDDSHYWDCNFEMAEILDGYSHCVSEHIRKAEKEWAERTSTQPPYPTGTRVKLSRGETGVIDGIYEHGAAQYLVKLDNDKDAGAPHHSRRIINFEDARPDAEAA